MAYLIIREPGRVAFTVQLGAELAIGRDADNDLVLADRQVSRRHGRIAEAAGGHLLKDLGSTHGTRVNGERVTEHVLCDGDVVQLGNVLCVFHPGPAEALSTGDSIYRTMTGIAEPPPRAAGPEARRLRVLFEVSRVVGALAEPDQVLERMLDMTLEVLDCERGVVGVSDGGSGAGRRITRARGAASADDMVVSRAVLDAMLERRESVLLRDPAGGEDGRPVRSAMGAPLQTGGRVLGFLYVDDRLRGDRFAPEDLDFLTALGYLAAAALAQAEAHRRAADEAAALRAEHPMGSLLGDSEPMRRLRAHIEKYAAAPDAPVLIRGETGSGKELVAAHVHARSTRAEQPFVALNCAAIPETMIESELFGHEKGAFTGAAQARRGRFACAHRGTLFLDEVGDLSLPAQAKLLRAIEEGEIQPLGAERPMRVDVRILSATHKDLEAEITAGRFREDLYYRLNVAEIEVPPLRVRGDDILLLADAFLERGARRLGKRVRGFSPAARTALRGYGWPGNVRQLANEIERALLVAEGAAIEVHDLRLRGGAAAPAGKQSLAERYTQLDAAAWDLTQEALNDATGNVSAAARLLGITPGMLERALSRDPEATVLAGSGEAAAAGTPEEPEWTLVEDAERQLLERALKANANNILATARALGVSRGTLYRKISKYGLQ